MYSATYSPEDNKLRLYTSSRLDSELYQRVKAAGFRWAPRQELFVKPRWTPRAEDLMIELAGSIDDEDTSLVQRQEDRADRFNGYSTNRAQDAESAADGVNNITKHIPLGQPILIGHHSEKRARRDAQKIENGMRRAVQMWETSEYWKYRAAGAIRHAKYKELPRVRARRIKKIEAEKRKQERAKKDAQKWLKLWAGIPGNVKKKDGTPLTKLEAAQLISGYCHLYVSKGFDGESHYTAWDVLKDDEERYKNCPAMTPEDVQEIAAKNYPVTIKYCDRWINHYENRLIYEKAMLEEQGGSDLIKPKPRPKQLPLLNYRNPEGIEIENNYHKGQFIHHEPKEMTKAEYMKIYEGRRGTETIENSHRLRISIDCGGGNYRRYVVFLTDSKTHKKPEPIKPEPTGGMKKSIEKNLDTSPAYTPPERNKFDDIKDQLKDGIKTIVAPQLFETPPDTAAYMVELAELKGGMCVLEPSAGTGNIVRAILNAVDTEVLGYEINFDLCKQLNISFPPYKLQIRQGDFLEVTDSQGKFERIIMNPPFKNGEDIKHINHAMKFLRPGGILVALCANGPRQQREFKDSAELWEPQEKIFAEQGTNVNSAILVLRKYTTPQDIEPKTIKSETVEQLTLL